MLNNQKRREILAHARATGYEGGILDLFKAAEQGMDIPGLLQQEAQAKQELVARTPEEQSVGLREQHAQGNTGASMSFPDVPANTSFSTEGMKAPINISKVDDQGHLISSYKNVPPGIKDLPTGPAKGTVIETPAYRSGGFKKHRTGGPADPPYKNQQGPRAIQNNSQGVYLPFDGSREYYLNDKGQKVSENKKGFGFDNGEYLLPTVVGGKQLSDEEAIQHYRSTGEHMGRFETPEQATKASRMRTNVYNEHPAYIKKYQTGGPKEKSWWDRFENSSIGKTIDARGLRKEKEHLQNYFSDHIWPESNFNPDTQEGRDDLGWLPGLGEIADATSATEAYKERRYADMAGYMAGLAVPFLPGKVVKDALKPVADKIASAISPSKKAAKNVTPLTDEEAYSIFEKRPSSSLNPYVERQKTVSKLHDKAKERFNTPEMRNRLRGIGIDPDKMKYPTLSFNSSSNAIGNHYNPDKNILNINIAQLESLKKDGHLYVSPEASYEHEMGHWLQKQAFQQEEALKFEKNFLYEGAEVDLKGTIADRHLTDTPLSERPIPDSANSDQSFVENSWSYFNADHGRGSALEAYPMIREMRQAMLEAGVIKNLESRVGLDEMISFMEKNKNRDRVSSFLHNRPKNDIERVRDMLNYTPVVAGGVMGARMLRNESNNGQPTEFRKGGYRQKYQTGGPEVQNYYGPMETPCRGLGCSEQATTDVANLFGVGDRNKLNPQDAWYKRAAVEKGGGEVIWEKGSEDYSNVRVGDFISLDRFGNKKSNLKSKAPGYGLEDNEANEHVGYIVGKDPRTGKLLVRHGSKNTKTFIQPIDDLRLTVPSSAGIPHTFAYKPQSIYRSAEVEGREVADTRFYKTPEPYKSLEKANPEPREEKFLDAVNSNQESQQVISGLSSEEVADLNKIAFGVFHMESEAGKSTMPIGGKMMAATALHSLGLKSTPASLSDVQLKYDYLHKNADGKRSKAGKTMDELGVRKQGLDSALSHRDDYNDEVNSVFSVLSNKYKKFISDPRYEYDPETKTVYGDIPIEQALGTIYKFSNYMNRPEKLREAIYGKKAREKSQAVTQKEQSNAPFQMSYKASD
tara:strand:+ start:2369 stop:5626 length:3258 start_codon:yes stop_codon:yes gene_type:complete